MTALQAADRLLADAVQRFHAGDRAEALRLVTLAVDTYPEHPQASLELARLLESAGDTSGAERVLRRVCESGHGTFALTTNLGVLLCRTGRGAEGIEWLRQAVALQPASAVAHYNYGNALKNEGRTEAAIEAYRAAIGCDPGYTVAYRNLGNALVSLGRVAEGAAAFQTGIALRRRPGAAALPGDDLMSVTSVSKLRHDIEQLEHLAARGLVSGDWRATIADYRAALVALPDLGSDVAPVTLPPEHRERLASTYNRLWHKYEAPRLPGGALNPAVDWAAVARDYEIHAPGITFVDGLLRPEALAELRRFCLESTVWFQFKYPNGYIGAFWEDGFWCPLLEQIAEELRLAVPAIFRHHTLRKCWGFKYDSRLSGIPMHADFAAVNVNFWIAPDSANLDPDHGGLVVWDKEAPRDWDFVSYNRDEARMRAFLLQSGARSTVIPHRQNRMVLFNSDLFHETDAIHFADGYENRRINITMLYGTRLT